MRSRPIHLGLLASVTGSHWASWRYPTSQPERGTDIRYYIDIAQIAERGKFDFIFLADGIAIYEGSAENQDRFEAALMCAQPKWLLEPFTLLAALAVATSRIGLVTTATTTYNEPYNIARWFASLDHISAGRAGWNVVTSANIAEAFNFGRDQHMPHAARYARAREFVQVVEGLWDTIGDGAHIRDKTSGIYTDVKKYHVLNHRGPHFAVRGPLNVPRPPQGRPVVVQAGSSEDGRNLAAEFAEIVFTAQHDLMSASLFAADIRRRVSGFGRDPATVKVMPGIVPYVGATEGEALEKLARLEALIPIDFALYMLSDRLGGADLTPYPLDGPLPTDLPEPQGSKSRSDLLRTMASEEGLTIRALAVRAASASAHKIVAGTPEMIVDHMEAWVMAGAADGFNIIPPFMPEGVNDFVEKIIPELRRRGLFRSEYEGVTLRDHLGLRRPPSRFE